MKISPIGKRVVLKTVKAESRTLSGIIIPETNQEKPVFAEVVAFSIEVENKEIELKDKFKNMGAQLLKEVSIKTNDVAGDGTTTATILAQAIVSEGLKNIAAGANPIIVQKGIKNAVKLVVDKIKSYSIPIDSNQNT